MVAIARGPSSLRSATMCTRRLPSSTTSLGHTRSINSCFGTTRSRRSTSATSTSNARAPTLAGAPSTRTLRCIASISMVPLRYLLLERVGTAASMAVRLGRLRSPGKCPTPRLIKINARPNDSNCRATDNRPGLVFETGLDSVTRGIMAVRLFAKKVSAFAAAVAFAISSLVGVATPVA